MSTKAVRTNSIIPLTPAEDQTGKHGFFVKASDNNKVAIVSAATDVPLGLIIYGESNNAGNEKSAIAIPGGLAGTYRVKLSGAVTVIGTALQLTDDGSVVADAGTGTRVIVAKALETGAADELIEAVLIEPQVLS